MCIQIANKIIDKNSLFQTPIIQWIGKHTLEIYVANVLSAILIKYIFVSEGKSILILSDIFITAILSISLWKVNSLIQKRLYSI